MEKIGPVLAEAEFTFEFKEPANLPNPMLAISDASFGYVDEERTPTTILTGVNRSVLAGQRIGILGANGQGKSTLVKTIARTMKPLAGSITEGKGLNIGYFAQQELDVLRPSENPLEHMIRLAKELGPDAKQPGREQDLRSYLGSFNFTGDMVKQAVGTMSGGEKARLVLAMIVWQRPNLLLLDEPTNHLDLDMRAALTLALQDFVGSLIVVSHDRALLETTTDQYWLIDAGQVKPFDGDLADYRAYRLAQQAADAAPRASAAGGAEVDRKTQKRQEAEARQRLSEQKKPLLKRLTALERELTPLNAEKAALDAQLADEAIYSAERKSEMQAALKRQGEVSARLAELEEDWLMVQMEIEALEEANI